MLVTVDGETIDITTNHSFYVENKWWVVAGDLEIGDTLVTVDREYNYGKIKILKHLINKIEYEVIK